MRYRLNFFLYRLNSRVGNSSMQAIQEENQADDEQEDRPARGEIEFAFI